MTTKKVGNHQVQLKSLICTFLVVYSKLSILRVTCPIIALIFNLLEKCIPQPELSHGTLFLTPK